MTMFDDEGFPNLSPLSFFQLEFDCYPIPQNDFEKKIEQGKYKIPSTTVLSGIEPFAVLYMGWNPEGLCFFVDAKISSIETFFPEVRRGDSIELFIDTRDVKTAGFNTKFCHHFFFLPEARDGHIKGEITRFRTEDAHELCNAHDLILHVKTHKKGYKAAIFIPAECLHGYDPTESKRLGFTYSINRLNGPSQCFSVLGEEYAFEQQPSTWSSVKLV